MKSVEENANAEVKVFIKCIKRVKVVTMWYLCMCVEVYVCVYACVSGDINLSALTPLRQLVQRLLLWPMVQTVLPFIATFFPLTFYVSVYVLQCVCYITHCVLLL